MTEKEIELLKRQIEVQLIEYEQAIEAFRKWAVGYWARKHGEPNGGPHVH